jgi:hypothetical protein
MDQDHEFSSLRNLLALKRLDMPNDTQVEEFLTEFHQRQRAQLLVRQSVFARTSGWIKERFASLQVVPSLSYASAVAAIAIVAIFGLSQQVQVTQVDGQSRLTFRMPSRDSSFAMLPGSLTSAPALTAKTSDQPSFVPARADSTATQYVLANNAQKAYDATVAF